jgi:hypothetical protein
MSRPVRGLALVALVALAALSVVATIVGQLLYPASSFDASAAVVFIAAVVSFAGVGAFLAFRVPANRVGWLLLLAGVVFAVQNVCAGYASASVAAGTTWPLTAYAALLANTLFVAPIVIAAAAVPLVFPDGHLPSPRWRWLAWLLVAGTTLAVLTPALTPGPINGMAEVPNPIGSDVLEPFLQIANGVASLTALPAFLGAFAAVAVRYRRGTSVERQQIKWLLAVALVAAIAFPAAFLLSMLAPGGIVGNVAMYVGFLGLIGLPLAIGIAILRYRLYEIDRLVSRTVGWALVTMILGAVFVGVIVGVQAVLAQITSENTIAVAASTLITAALFQPVRRRVQRAVDRRFDRARYDGERVVGSFGERLRDQLDLATLPVEVANVARETVRPTTVGVWLRTVRDDNPARIS